MRAPLFSSPLPSPLSPLCALLTVLCPRSPAGLFDVLQSKATLALNALTRFANTSFERITVQGCQRLDQVCSYGLQVCASQRCNIDVLISIGEVVTINDNGNVVALKDCPVACSDAQLRASTADFALGVLCALPLSL